MPPPCIIALQKLLKVDQLVHTPAFRATLRHFQTPATDFRPYCSSSSRFFQAVLAVMTQAII